MEKMPRFNIVLVVGLLAVTCLLGSTAIESRAAVTIQAGDVIKGDTAALYFVGPDNKRYVFPKDNIYFSWFSDFSQVKKVTQAELTAVLLGGNISSKPASLIQFVTEDSSGRIVVSDPNVYVVDDVIGKNVNAIYRIANPEQAVGFFGVNWEKKIVPVLESLYTNYTLVGNLTNDHVLNIPPTLSSDAATQYTYTNAAGDFSFSYWPGLYLDAVKNQYTDIDGALRLIYLTTEPELGPEGWYAEHMRAAKNSLTDGGDCQGMVAPTASQLECKIIKKNNVFGQESTGLTGVVDLYFIPNRDTVPPTDPAFEYVMIRLQPEQVVNKELIINSFQFTN